MSQLTDALTESHGPPRDLIHTALPPLHLGGGADVVCHPDSPLGCLYITDGVRLQAQGLELAMVTPQPDDRIPPILSNLGRAALRTHLAAGGSLPIDGVEGLEALGLTSHRSFWLGRVGEVWTRVVLCVGLTREELPYCRTHGTAAVLELLGGVTTELGRSTRAVPTTEAPGVGKGLSWDGEDALRAVIDVNGEEVEGRRGVYPPEDIPRLAGCWDALVAWDQRVQLYLLLQDTDHPAVKALGAKLIAQAAGRELAEGGSEHSALAVALAWREGDLGRFDAYWEDLDAAMVAARAD